MFHVKTNVTHKKFPSGKQKKTPRGYIFKLSDIFKRNLLLTQKDFRLRAIFFRIYKCNIVNYLSLRNYICKHTILCANKPKSEPKNTSKNRKHIKIY